MELLYVDRPGRGSSGALWTVVVLKAGVPIAGGDYKGALGGWAAYTPLVVVVVAIEVQRTHRGTSPRADGGGEEPHYEGSL
jgi:hypothetical protein